MKRYGFSLPWLARLACAAALTLAVLAPVRAASVLPLHLDEIIDKSALAFAGTCVESRSERDAQTGFIVTYTTFAVDDVLKGATGTRYTIKQLGGDLPAEDLHYRVEGVPRFAVGRDYVIFLPQPSAIGFASPIGLEQGRFTVEGRDGKRVVSNGRDFRDTASRMLPTLPPAVRLELQESRVPVREIDLQQFKELVRGRAGLAQVLR